MGRKAKNLTDKTRELILSAAAKGSCDIEIRRAIKVSFPVWSRWLRDNPGLADDILDARLPSCEEVENALYRRAVGYDVEESFIEKKAMVDEDGNELTVAEVKTRTTIKHFAPDVTAATFILQNRRSDRWKPASRIDDGGGKALYLVKLPD